MVKFCLGLLFLWTFIPLTVSAEEDPDELYRKGLFAEAEKAYSLKDMDNPKDIRYRYNRGCAAYQNGDYKGATAAFSSVLRRTKNKGIRYRAAHNLGNAAYKQGDFQGAVDSYKNAILENPTNESTRFNLELALRALEKQKREQEQKEQQQQEQQQQEPGQGEADGSEPEQGDEKGDQEDSRDEKQGNGEQRSGEEKEAKQDLSGDLQPLQDMPEKGEAAETEAETIPGVDRNKAEALLDNIKEDRARFLRFQIPEEKRRGVASGKNW